MQRLKLIFEYKNGQSILFKPQVLNMFQYFKQNSPNKTEAGGYLIGEQYGRQVIVNVATAPGKEDVRKRFFMKRDNKRGELLLNRIWKRSQRKNILLGEWHTHPEINPTPSSHDISQINLSYENNFFPLGCMLIVIVGNHTVTKSWVGIKIKDNIFRIERTGFKLWKG